MSSNSDIPSTTYTPVTSPLPPPPEEDVFTPVQWAVLLAIGDTIIPSIHPSDGSTDPSTQLSIPTAEFNATKAILQDGLDDSHSEESAHLINTYLDENVSSIPQAKDCIKSLFSRHIHNEGRKGLSFVLTALRYVPTNHQHLTTH